VRRFGDPVLKSRAAAVDRFDDGLRAQIERMSGLMHDALGIGLAAPQIGVSQQLLVYRVGPEGPDMALVNPEIEWSSRETEEFEEGCLSIPGILVDVDRPVHVRVTAQDEHGDLRVVEASGLEARVIQHEVDHLNGVLILDRTSKEQRKEAIRALREAEREAA
jgi:peptide deformylase